MERDFTIRFTDVVYASEEDIKKALSISSIDAIWDKIKVYRNFFRKNVDLISNEKKIFNICLNPTLINRATKLESKITRLVLNFYNNQNVEKEKVKEVALRRIINSFSRDNNLPIDDDRIDKIIHASGIIGQPFLTLVNYIEIIKLKSHMNDENYSRLTLIEFYGSLLRKKIDINDPSNYLRLVDYYIDSNQLLNRNTSFGKVEDLEVMLNDLINFNNDSTLPAILKATVTYFYLIYIKPFDYFNEECATLSLKYILTDGLFQEIPYLFNLEDKLLNINAEDMVKNFYKTVNSLDLTYFINYLLDIIETEIKNFETLILEIDKEEFVPEVSKVKEPQIFNQVNNSVSALNFEQRIALPTLPVGLNENDIDIIAQNLLELYPTLKKAQAKFYAEHCTIGKYYSIAQYKDANNVAYETARTSMDNLVTLGFYKKEQIKNRFVYTPVVR